MTVSAETYIYWKSVKNQRTVLVIICDSSIVLTNFLNEKQLQIIFSFHSRLAKISIKETVLTGCAE